MRRNVVGRYRQRLAELLLTAGFQVAPEHIHWARGVWAQADCKRWECFAHTVNRPGLPDGLLVELDSWDTIVACVRSGVEIDQHERAGPTHFNVHARSKCAALATLAGK